MTPEEAAQLLDVGTESELTEVSEAFYTLKDQLQASSRWGEDGAAYERAFRVLRAESVKRTAQASRENQTHLDEALRARRLEHLAHRVQRPAETKVTRDEAASLLETAPDSDSGTIHRCYANKRKEFLAAGTWPEQARRLWAAKDALLRAAAERTAEAERERARVEREERESLRLARAEATREGWPTDWPLDDLSLWRQTGWIGVSKAWAIAGWCPTTNDLHRLIQLAHRTGKQVLRPPRGRASSWAPASPALARALSSGGIRVGTIAAIKRHGSQSISGYEPWIDAGQEERAVVWAAKSIPAELAAVAVDAGIDVRDVSSVEGLRGQLATRARLTTPAAGLPAISAPVMLRSKDALFEGGDGVLLRTHCRESRLATLRRESKSWVVTDCDAREHHLALDDWWQAIYCLLGDRGLASLEPVGLDRGRFLLVLAPLTTAMEATMVIDGEEWWTVAGWPTTSSDAGTWAELDRVVWSQPVHLEETFTNSVHDWQFVLRCLGDHFLSYEYSDTDVSVKRLDAVTQDEALQDFQTGATDPWEEDRADEEIELAVPLVVRTWRGQSGLTGGAAIDEVVEISRGRLVHRGVGDSPAGIYGPEDLGTADDDKARIIAIWLDDLRALTAAALALEPLDPDRKLSAEQRRELTRLVTHRFDGVEFRLDAETLAAVRQHLQESPTYTRVAGALREPLSHDGLALAESLREAERRQAAVEEPDWDPRSL